MIASQVDIERSLKEFEQTGLSRPGVMDEVPLANNDVRIDGDQDGWWPRLAALVYGLLPASPASKLPALLAALLDSADEFKAGFNEKPLVHARQRVVDSGSNDKEAIGSVLDETFRLVHVVREQQEAQAKATRGETDGAHHNKGTGDAFSCSKGNAEEPIGTLLQPLGQQGAGRAPGSLGYFLALIAEVWGCLYGPHPHDQHRVHAVWQRFKSKATSGNVFQDLVHLAAIACGETVVLDPGTGTRANEGYIPPDANGRVFEGWPHSLSQQESSPGESASRYPPWAPALELMCWGVVPTLNAENVLLSCIEAVAIRTKRGKGRLGTGLSQERGVTSSKALIAVVTAIARGYHGVAVGEDLSGVLLADLLNVAQNSPTKVNAEVRVSCSYHSMDLCRLLARLAIV